MISLFIMSLLSNTPTTRAMASDNWATRERATLAVPFVTAFLNQNNPDPEVRLRCRQAVEKSVVWQQAQSYYVYAWALAQPLSDELDWNSPIMNMRYEDAVPIANYSDAHPETFPWKPWEIYQKRCNLWGQANYYFP